MKKDDIQQLCESFAKVVSCRGNHIKHDKKENLPRGHLEGVILDQTDVYVLKTRALTVRLTEVMGSVFSIAGESKNEDKKMTIKFRGKTCQVTFSKKFSQFCDDPAEDTVQPWTVTKGQLPEAVMQKFMKK